jgi:hypothetical protein
MLSGVGLDISAYSQLFLVTTDIPEDYENDAGLVGIPHIPDGFDRMDGRAAGLYGRIGDVHLWWQAEHGTHQIPADELAARATTQIDDVDSRAYFADGYADWRRAFELAAQDGFVILH